MAFDGIGGGGARRFALGTVIGASLTVLSRNLFRFLGIMLAVGVPIAIAIVLTAMAVAGGSIGEGGTSVEFSGPGSLAALVLLILLAMAGYFLIQAALTYGALQTLRGRSVAIGASLGVALAALPRLMLAGLLLLAGATVAIALPSALIGAIMGGSIATGDLSAAVGLSSLVVMAIALAISVLVWVFIPAMVVERLGPIGGFRRSFALTKGRRWPICGLLLLLFAANFVASAITQLLMRGGAPAGGAVLNLLAVLFFMGFSAVLGAVGYYMLRAEKEGVALDDVAQVFD